MATGCSRRAIWTDRTWTAARSGPAVGVGPVAGDEFAERLSEGEEVEGGREIAYLDKK